MGQISFQDISKSFGAVRALSGVTFPVAEGEAHALVGENGAGKSTLMRVLAGIVRPDAGQLIWNGQPLDLRSPRVDASPASGVNPPIERAREAVWSVILAVGGLATPVGSVLWHVVGWERSLKEWALERGWAGRTVSQEAASGILVAALGILEALLRSHPRSGSRSIHRSENASRRWA